MGAGRRCVQAVQWKENESSYKSMLLSCFILHNNQKQKRFLQ